MSVYFSVLIDSDVIRIEVRVEVTVKHTLQCDTLHNRYQQNKTSNQVYIVAVSLEKHGV